MNITITGSLGNISRRLAGTLAAKGHRVTVVSHSPERVKDIERLHAIPAIGSVEDPGFLLDVFAHADAVYTMIPPNYSRADLRAYMRTTGEGYARAIEKAGVGHVVNLSSVGAHLPDGPGPTGANHYVEERLNALTGTHVLHLRPGMFYTNFFGAMPMIAQQHSIGNNFDAAVNIPLSHPQDIASAAADALDSCLFTGKNIRYVVSDEKSGGEIATILGQAIGLPDLAWVCFSDEALLQGMIQNGLTREMATVYVVEIGIALRNGMLAEDYRRSGDGASGSAEASRGAEVSGNPEAPGKTSFADFAKEFAAVYARN